MTKKVKSGETDVETSLCFYFLISEGNDHLFYYVWLTLYCRQLSRVAIIFKFV